jgi:hypothetical protein
MPPKQNEQNEQNAPLNGGQAVRTTKFWQVVVVITTPWLIYVLLLCAFLFCFHNMAPVTWILVAVCFGLSLLLLGLGIFVSRLLLFIGVLSLASTLTATLVGMWLHENYLGRYYLLQQPAVGPLNPHGSPPSQDIALYQFIDGTFVDDKRTMGYKVGNKLFCVAPVSFPMAYNDSIEYWATGQDCCEPQQHFDCGTARIPGSVMAIAAEPHEAYDKAAIESKAAYDSWGPGKPHFVYFIETSDKYMEYLWCFSLTIYLSSAAIDFLMCAVGAAIFAKWPVRPRVPLN